MGAAGYRKGETKPQFLARQGAGPGPADPEKVPYYLLIVGDPATIPYRVQSQIGVQYAVGRLHFDAVEDYAWYARSVVAAETGGLSLPRRASFFGVANPDDGATLSSARHLVAPLVELFANDKKLVGWSVESQMREAATRGALETLINGGDTPALLFAASHGMGFGKGDPFQIPQQGALLCQDWPGPKEWRGKPIPEDFYFGGADVAADANLQGTMAFLFACYGAGTPELDEFASQAFKERAAIAPYAFAAGLPKALLNRPKGGALAVIGHVERAWGHSFMAPAAGGKGATTGDIGVFESTLRSMMGGTPIGAAMEYFDQRYAELSSDLSVALEERDNGVEVDEYELARMWTANNDARGYAILGDPAVRLPLAAAGAAPVRATPMAYVLGSSGAGTPAPAAAVAPAPAAVPDGAADAGAESFGLLGRVLGREESTSDKPPTVFQGFIKRISETLAAAAESASVLEVSTWVAADLTQTRVEGGKVIGAELYAYSKVALDGDSVVVLKDPKDATAHDQAVWALHIKMVEQAHQARGELLRTLASVASSLTSLS